MRYFLTFACYGQWIHGSQAGSVDKNHNRLRGPLLEEDSVRLTNERRLLRCPPYLLDEQRRLCVLDAIRERCSYAGWNLLAAHVRSNHVHLVVEAEIPPELVMNSVKSYASRVEPAWIG